MDRTSAMRAGRRRMIVIGLAGAMVVGAAAFLWFRPDKAFVDTQVNENLPGVSGESENRSGGAGGPEEPEGDMGEGAASEIVARGSFVGLAHETTGSAIVIEAGRRRFVRLEEFATSAGPDVIVILSKASSATDDPSAYEDGEFVDLGLLKGNVGNQNYAIPAGVEVSKYGSVVIWCRRFNVAFGAAPLDL